MSQHPDRAIIAKLGLFIEEAGGLQQLSELTVAEAEVIGKAMDDYIEELAAPLSLYARLSDRTSDRCCAESLW